MHNVDHRTGMEIPFGVSSEDIMRSLEMGHGYKWTVLLRDPFVTAHGMPTVGNMPELLLTGKQTLIVAGGDPLYVERIKHMLSMLQKLSPRLTGQEALNLG